jgi:hypothetical protein
MKAAAHWHGCHFVAKRSNDRLQGLHPGRIGPRGQANQQPLADAQDIASVKGSGEIDALDRAVFPQLRLDARRFAAP